LGYDRYEGEDQQQQLLVVVDPGEVLPPLTLCHKDKAVEDLPRAPRLFCFSGSTKKAVMKTRPFYFRK